MLWFKKKKLFLYHQINISSLYINKRKEKNQKYRACTRKCMCTHATSHSGVSVCIVKVIGRYGHGTQNYSCVAPLHGHGNPLQQVVVRQRLSSLHPKTVAQLWFGRQYQQLYQSMRANYNHRVKSSDPYYTGWQWWTEKSVPSVLRLTLKHQLHMVTHLFTKNMSVYEAYTICAEILRCLYPVVYLSWGPHVNMRQDFTLPALAPRSHCLCGCTISQFQLLPIMFAKCQNGTPESGNTHIHTHTYIYIVQAVLASLAC